MAKNQSGWHKSHLGQLKSMVKRNGKWKQSWTAETAETEPEEEEDEATEATGTGTDAGGGGTTQEPELREA